MICAAGLERRDYPTLMEAVDGLDVRVVIAAASPWSTKSDSTENRDIPSNVEVRRLSLFELRDLYAASRFVVMPLFDVEFQAGITTILEAMSMGHAVVCTRTEGQTDTIIEGETGLYVRPGDVGRAEANAGDAARRRCSCTRLMGKERDSGSLSMLMLRVMRPSWLSTSVDYVGWLTPPPRHGAAKRAVVGSVARTKNRPRQSPPMWQCTGPWRVRAA